MNFDDRCCDVSIVYGSVCLVIRDHKFFASLIVLVIDHLLLFLVWIGCLNNMLLLIVMRK